MRGVEHDGDAGLLFVENELLLHADVDDDAAAAAALFPVDEAARITVGRRAVGVIGMVCNYYGRVWDFSEHRRSALQSIFRGPAEAEMAFLRELSTVRFV